MTLPLALFSIRLSGLWGVSAAQWQSVLRSAFTVHLPMIISVVLFCRFVDRRSLGMLGFHGDARLRKVGLGMLTATTALSVVFVVLHYSDLIAAKKDAVGRMGGSTIVIFFQQLVLAFAEELLMLGYVVTNLRPHLRTSAAAMLSAAIFATAHCLNHHLSVVGVLNLFLMGLAMALYYVRTNDIIGPIAAHWLWNFIQGPILGFPVSGLYLVGTSAQEINGPPLLTGGRFGLEGSVISTAVLLLISGFFIAVSKRQQEFASF